MPDSVLGDGTDDVINLSQGNLGFAFGPGTIAAIVKYASLAGGHRCVFQAGDSSNRYALFTDPSNLIDLVLNGTESTSSLAVAVVDGWMLVAGTKADGTVAPRLHRYIYGTDTWSHENAGATSADSSVPAAETRLFVDAGASYMHGNILIAGVWDVVLSDAELEALTSGLQAWVDASPVEGWRLNAISGIESFAVGGTSDETSRTGTTVDTGDAPAGWSDELGEPVPGVEAFVARIPALGSSALSPGLRGPAVDRWDQWS